MKYLKAWLINFLVIFFANHLLPGIGVKHAVKLPHISGEILFALGLGLFNSLLCPILSIGGRNGLARVALVALILNFSAYALLRFFPIDLHVETVEGYLFASLTASLAAILTYFVETKKKTVTESLHEPKIEEDTHELH